MTRSDVLEILAQQGAVSLAEMIPPKMRKETAIWAFIESLRVAVPCGHCREPIGRRSDCIRDHKISLRSVDVDKRHDHDQPWNQWYLCHSCNSTKTSKRGLSGLGSDAARLAKLRRVEKGKQQKCRPSIPSRPFQKPCKMLADKGGQPIKRIPARPFPKRTDRIPSRPFPSKAREKSGE